MRRMDTATHPRDTITPAAFAVAPELVGTPLAAPWRRGVAMGIDLILAALLASALKAPSILAAAGLSVFLYRWTARKQAASPAARRLWNALRIAGIVLLFGTSIAAFSSLSSRVRERIAGNGEVDEKEATISGKGVKLEGSILEAGITVSDIVRLARAKDEASASAAAERITRRVARAGLSPEEVRDLRVALERPGEIPLSPAAQTALKAALQKLEGEGDSPAAAPPPSPDSLVLALADALRTGTAAEARPLRRQLATTLARDTLEALLSKNQKLSQRVDRLQEENDQLTEEREAADRKFDPIRLIRVLLDDLGIGIGWTALYFTFFTTAWRGRTPGKRLLGIRVIQLDGKPLGWWASFERFGGYAAGFVTGLFGFAQIYWDRNRQAIHDKISETVVIRG
jgi:hypothetical protein